MTAAALMSNHSLEGEEETYAGEAHIGGVEGIERADFKKLSKAFNDRVFGDGVEVEGKTACFLHFTPHTLVSHSPWSSSPPLAAAPRRG